MGFFANVSSLFVSSVNISTITMTVRESAFETLRINRSDVAVVDAGDTQAYSTRLLFTDGSLQNLPGSRRRLSGSHRELQGTASYPTLSDAQNVYRFVLRDSRLLESPPLYQIDSVTVDGTMLLSNQTGNRYAVPSEDDAILVFDTIDLASSL